MKIVLNKKGKKVNPYRVPPFKAQPPAHVAYQYFWWSWHPCYPYWSKSCWGGPTIEEAYAVLEQPRAKHTLAVYDNRLVREGDGQLTVVAHLPCERLDVWQEFARNKNGWRKATDAKPIKGWDKR